MKGRRWTIADGDIGDGCGAVDRCSPGDFQFQTISWEPTDDPLGAMQLEAAEGGKAKARLLYACPKTGKPCGGILIGHPDKPAVTPSWRWDGNVEAPTLTPSINCTGGCGWHGWLTNGEFTSC